MDRTITLVVNKDSSLSPAKTYTHHHGLRMLVGTECIRIFSVGILDASFYGKTAMTDAHRHLGYKLGMW